MMAMSLMHIPKTGGAALSAALGRHVHRMSHSMRLEDMPIWPPIITICRDPVARWISGWDMVLKQRVPREYEQWPTAEDAALNPEALTWLEEYWGLVFKPQTYWLRDAIYARTRCWYIAHTERLDDDFAIIRDAIGAVGCEMPNVASRRHNANQGVKSVLTPEAADAVRAYYREDCELLEGLR